MNNINFLGIEHIQPYKNVYEYSLYKYSDAIEIGKNHICDFKFIKVDLEDVYISKNFEKSMGYCMIYNFENEKIIYDENFIESVKHFIIYEIPNINIKKESIFVALPQKI